MVEEGDASNFEREESLLTDSSVQSQESSSLSSESAAQSSENSAESSSEPSENLILRQELASLREELASMKGMLSGISSIVQTKHHETQTIAHSQDFQSPLSSIGNGGVPTNRQTDIRQTEAANLPVRQTAFSQPTSISKEKDMLSIVDNLKHELKLKFRNLTKQEFKVFSAVYVMEEQGDVDYRNLASYVGLTESSIRDYIMKMERKGIPIAKVRINNKKVVLQVRQELRQIISLDSLMKIREPVFR